MAQDQTSASGWPAFVVRANDALKASQPTHYDRHISLMLEPHFRDHVLLQLQWHDGVVRWFRSTWLKLEDAPKFTNPIGQLKYIGKTVFPTIQTETGILEAGRAEPLLERVRGLSIRPCIDREAIVLDGCLHTLRIGVGQEAVSYEWNYLPEAFKELQGVADLLEELFLRP